MGRNIVICSDGTGNTFDRHLTNVTHLIKCLALDDGTRQVAAYDQGLGTTKNRQAAIDQYQQSLPHPKNLQVLPAPLSTILSASVHLDRLRGLLFGYGLKENVRQMYEALTTLYQDADDRIFLFGFSRGAFTVRALAGLLYRCHLPPKGATDLTARFENAWHLFQPMCEDPDKCDQFRAEQRPCPIHFLGVWDTVKSYGGLDPVILPHLRHNPIVSHVRHALALHEHRAWFKPTTWGQLDIDRDNAMTRVKPEDLPRYNKQCIEEVWFAGCHSDIGGGDEEEITARIAFRWMLGEAVNMEDGLVLNQAGRDVLASDDKPIPPTIHESWNRRWWVTEQIRRQEINNSGVYPVKQAARGSDGQRNPGALRRGGAVCLHSTVGDRHSIAGPIEIRQTRAHPT